MEKKITIKKMADKITITYFSGEYSEWFVKSEKNIKGDEIRAIDQLFNILVNTIDKEVKSFMVELSLALEKEGIGKHFFKIEDI